MTLSGYQEWVRARWAKNPRAEDLAIATMGLNGDVAVLALELGDVIHYATVLANAFGLTLEGVLLSNVAKLETRELKAAAAAALPKEEHLA